MHYYQHHIADFRSGTIHMPRLMRWLYRDLLECYYDREKPLPVDPEEVCDLIGAFEAVERELVPRILKMKFKLADDGWRQERCDEALSAYLANQVEDDERQANEAERQRRHREARKELFRKLRDDFDIVPPYDTKTTDLRTLLESKTSQLHNAPVTRDITVTNEVRTTDATAITNNQEPLTINQEPLKAEAPPAKRSSDASGTRLPKDWKPSPEDTEYCKTERPDLLPSKVAQNFYDYWIAKAGKDGRKTDWSATWRSWVRKEDSKAAGRPGAVPAQNLKWNPNGQDRSADANFAAEAFKRFGKVGPITDEEIEI